MKLKDTPITHSEMGRMKDRWHLRNILKSSVLWLIWHTCEKP